MSLVVQLWSFSYHRGGVPSSSSPHGGGFVFDCRGLPNPHFEAGMASQDGRDLEVRQWLGGHVAVQEFQAAAELMIKQTVASYAELGRDHLLVSFGCTGGRHRSVFLAESLRRVLESEGVEVSLRHRELEEEKIGSSQEIEGYP